MARETRQMVRRVIALVVITLVLIPMAAVAKPKDGDHPSNGGNGNGKGPKSTTTTSTTTTTTPSDGTVVVSPANLRASGWHLERWTTLEEVDPAPPLGTGALYFLRSGGGRTAAKYSGLDGTPLADLTTIEYAAMEDGDRVQVALAVDSEALGVADHVLVFIPPREPDGWARWDAIAGPWLLYTGTEYATKSDAETISWSDYQLRHPDAVLRPLLGSPGSVYLNFGPAPGQLPCADCVYLPAIWEGYADALTLQVRDASAVTFDFEAAP